MLGRETISLRDSAILTFKPITHTLSSFPAVIVQGFPCLPAVSLIDESISQVNLWCHSTSRNNARLVTNSPNSLFQQPHYLSKVIGHYGHYYQCLDPLGFYIAAAHRRPLIPISLQPNIKKTKRLFEDLPEELPPVINTYVDFIYFSCPL